jgi:SH3 domain protein
MKRVGNIYSKIYDMDNLKEAHRNARKDKLFYKEVVMVDSNPDFYLGEIQKMLKNHSYHVEKDDYTVSTINDKGKERELWKLPYYPHRIIQWAVMLQIEPVFNTVFTDFTCASLPNRGIHKAQWLINQYLKDEPGTEYNALLNLVTDICQRNGIKELKWKGDKSLIGQVDKQNMTVHRWFANKACPGDYLYNLHPTIAAEVNKRLGGVSTTTPTTENGSQATTGATAVNYLVRVTASVLNIRKGPGTGYGITGQIKDKGVYTIVAESGGWGKLKSGAGWISLDYAKKV